MGSTVIPAMLRVRDVADLLGVGLSTAYDLAYSGTIESVVVGKGNRRFVAEAVYGYIESLRAGTDERVAS